MVDIRTLAQCFPWPGPFVVLQTCTRVCSLKPSLGEAVIHFRAASPSYATGCSDDGWG